MTSRVFDYPTGLLISSTDANGQATQYSYADEQGLGDPLNRLRKVTRPDGGWTRYEFNDVVGNLYTHIETKQDGTRTLHSYQYLDALGRVIRSLALEGGTTYIATDTQYDSMGRVWRVSNPYRTSGLGGQVNPSAMWTTSIFDALGRVKQLTLPDNTTVQTGYQGVYTTVTDQAGKVRRQKVDALGRVVRVDEPDAVGNLGSFDVPLQATYYDYDSLGDLVHVAQGTGTQIQHRYFKFDGLGRLTYERQIEQAVPFTASDPVTGNSKWSRKIVYDETINSVTYKGLVTSLYDAKNVRTQFLYDNLSRVYQVSYSDGTPTTDNYYDEQQAGYFNKGRLTRVSTDAAGVVPQTSRASRYDLMGRAVYQQQIVGTNVYQTSYSYNLADQLISQTYPSGKVVNYGYDNAARLQSVTGGSGTTYASNLTYAPHGKLSAATLGNGAVSTYEYSNTRLQLTAVNLVKGSNTLQRLEYKYGVVDSATGDVDATKNNGQIGCVESWIGAAKQWQQRYAYDSVGRLSTASEYRGDNEQLSYLSNYDYDAFGNRYQYASRNGSSLGYVAVEDGQINKATNRFTSGVTYDDLGQITADNKFRGCNMPTTQTDGRSGRRTSTAPTR